MIKKIAILALCFIFTAFNVNAQNLSARVSRTELPYGETLMLILDYDGNDMNLRPDLSVLDKDFKIFSTSQSHSTQIINGKTSSSNQWQIALMPKTSGALTIPEITLGDLKSNPIALNVFEGNINGQEGTPTYTRFELSAEVEQKEAYLQSQLNYTLTLLDAGGLQANAPQFIGNQDGEWIIKQIKQPTVENKTINNVNVREIKFYYALFPQKSGWLETPAIELNGYYINPNSSPQRLHSLFNNGFFDTGIDIFDMGASRSPISLGVKPEKIEIKPIVAEYGNNWWLPAKAVEIQAQWKDENQKFKAGEAVERIISLAAIGVLDTQLPELKVQQSDVLKQYPEKPIRSAAIDEKGNIIAVEEMKNVYIPQKAGKITVPSISVAWFDTINKQVKYAVIPEETIIVEPNPDMMPERPHTDYTMPDFGEKQAAKTMDQRERSETTYYQSMLAILLAFFAGLLLAYVLFGRKNKISEKAVEIKDKDIENLAKNSDFKGLRDALIIWAKNRYKTAEISDLQAVDEKVQNKDFSEAISSISQNLYSRKKQDWDPEKFIKIFNKIKKQKTKAKKVDDPLPKLYKDKM